MALKPEEKISLLQYKLFFEELEVVDNLFQKGQADLLAHVTNFRENLSSEVEGQRENFNEHFFGNRDIEKNIDNSADHTQQYNDSNINDEVLEKNISHERWAKNLFRKIVFATHPDKTQNLAVPALVKKLSKYYNLVVEKFSIGAYEDLLFVGYELDLELPEGKVNNLIDPKNEKMLSEINTKKNSIAYQWQTIPETQKHTILKNHLTSLGYIFKEKDIEETFERVKRIKRKLGTRPVNHIRKRVK